MDGERRVSVRCSAAHTVRGLRLLGLFIGPRLLADDDATRSDVTECFVVFTGGATEALGFEGAFRAVDDHADATPEEWPRHLGRRRSRPDQWIYPFFLAEPVGDIHRKRAFEGIMS